MASRMELYLSLRYRRQSLLGNYANFLLRKTRYLAPRLQLPDQVLLQRSLDLETPETNYKTVVKKTLQNLSGLFSCCTAQRHN